MHLQNRFAEISEVHIKIKVSENPMAPSRKLLEYLNVFFYLSDSLNVNCFEYAQYIRDHVLWLNISPDVAQFPQGICNLQSSGNFASLKRSPNS